MATSQNSTATTYGEYANRFWQLKSLAISIGAAVHASDHADAPDMVDVSYSLEALSELADRFALEAFEKPYALEVSNG